MNCSCVPRRPRQVRDALATDAREVVADARVEHGTAEAQWECEPGVGPGRQTSHILL